MANFGEQHCRLCLSTISDEHFKEIKDDTKSIFDFLLLKLDLDNNSKYIMCIVCSRRIMEAFRFKSMCFNTYNTIIPYVNDETVCSVNLKEIYLKQTENKHLIPTLEEYRVCRCCMQLVNNKFISAHEMAVDMIEIYIPEINLTMIEDPVICKQCFDSFVSHSNFIMNCLEVNTQIKSFCDTSEVFYNCLEGNEDNKSWHPEVVDTSIWMPAVDSSIKTEEMYIKSENEQEGDWLETDSAMVRSLHEGISNKISYSEIKVEDEYEKSEAAHVTDSVWADSVNQYNPSQEDKYSGTDHNSTLSRLLITHKDTCKIFECDTCAYKTKRKDNLKRHMLRHKDFTETEVFAYDTCSYITKYKKHIKRHLLRRKDITETEVFKCDACDYKTERKVNLKKHLLRHKDFTETEVFACDTCSYITKYKKHLKRHLLTHKDISETEVFKCDTCDFKTKRQDSFRRHFLTHKDISETKIFECDTCDFKNKRKDKLTRHLLTHIDMSEREVFKCGICDYTTRHKTGIQQHQLKHRDISETKVFHCDMCDFKTKYRSNLKGHQLKHKDITETEVYECDTCDYKTKRKDNLRIHLLTHKNISEIEVFGCDTCDYTTKHKTNLKRHQMNHKDISEREVFQCDTCDYKSNQKGNLKRHRLTHQNILKVEVCDIKVEEHMSPTFPSFCENQR